MTRKLSAMEIARRSFGNFIPTREALQERSEAIEAKDKAVKAAPMHKGKPVVVEKRKRGRPRKHESGGQISVWFDDDLREAIKEYAEREGFSFSDAVNVLLILGLTDQKSRC